MSAARKNADEFTVNTSGVGELLNGLQGRFDGDDGGGRDGATPPKAKRPAGPARTRRDAPERKPEEPEPRSKYTLLLASSDALTLDELALRLRRRTGRRVEKSEIMRALVRLTERPDVFDALGAAIERGRAD